jgi:branched-subunit amino acid ABC-type transport system permease component
MQACLSRLAALVAAVLLAAVALVGSASGAMATVAPAADETCKKPPPSKGDSIHMIGCLTDNRDKPPSPVPDVAVTVEDESGKVVGKDTSDQEGVFDVTLPGTSVDNLGKSYTIKIDTESLPKGTSLVDKKKTSLTSRITTDADIFVTFPIGDETAAGAGKVTQFLQLAVGGITFSLLLALAALGLSLIFGTTGLTNFAHGELVTFGAIAALAVDRLPGEITIGGVNVTVITAAIAAFVIAGFLGWVQDKGLWSPLRRRNTGLVAMMIITIGLSIFLRSLFQYFIGGGNYSYSQYTTADPFKLGPVLITPTQVGVSVVALTILVAASLMLQRTRLGKATRAVADNPALAAASGINVERVIRLVWIGGAALAGISGVGLGLTQGFNYQFGFKILLLIFAAVVLGGLGTIWGALVGSFVIGILIEVSTIIVPAELKYVSALAVLIIVLVVRPQGILGRRERIG